MKHAATTAMRVQMRTSRYRMPSLCTRRKVSVRDRGRGRVRVRVRDRARARARPVHEEEGER